MSRVGLLDRVEGDLWSEALQDGGEVDFVPVLLAACDAVLDLCEPLPRRGDGSEGWWS